MDLAARIARRRRELGLTQAQVAERASAASDLIVRQSDVSTWEHGTWPLARAVAPLADALEAPVRWLLTGEGPKPMAPPAESHSATDTEAA